MVVGAMETIAIARYRRPDARMTPDERHMAVTGLAESAKVLPSDVVAQISSLSAPVMACFGFALYFLRLAELESAYRANKRDDRMSATAEQFLSQQNPTMHPEAPAPPLSEANGFVTPPKSFVQSLQEP